MEGETEKKKKKEMDGKVKCSKQYFTGQYTQAMMLRSSFLSGSVHWKWMNVYDRLNRYTSVPEKYT